MCDFITLLAGTITMWVLLIPMLMSLNSVKRKFGKLGEYVYVFIYLILIHIIVLAIGRYIGV